MRGALTKESEIDGVCHGFVSGWSRVQVVAAVVLRRHSSWVCGIAECPIKINEAVKGSRGSDPLVHCHPLRFATCGPSTKSLVRKDRGAENLQSSGMRPGDDLFVPNDDVVGGHGGPAHTRVGAGSGSVGLADVVRSFEKNHALNSCLCEDIAA